MKIDGTDIGTLRDGAETAATVAAAHRAGLLRALADGPGSADEVAERAGLDPRATRIVLGALADFGLVERRDGAWGATDECRRRLCDPSHPDYAGGGLDHWLDNLRVFALLDEVLASGRPPDVDDAAGDEGDLARYMAAMAAAPDERVRRIVATCLERNPDARRALDLGGGPGRMARGFVDAGLDVTLFDTPETLEHVGREYGLEDVDGLELVAGDFTVDPLPAGPWDIVLMSNIVHIYDADTNRRLLARVGDVTAPGGVAAVMDFVRGLSPRAARFALVMLLRTEAGDTWELEEISGWMRDAGFGDVRVDEMDAERELVSGVRTSG